MLPKPDIWDHPPRSEEGCEKEGKAPICPQPRGAVGFAVGKWELSEVKVEEFVFIILRSG
jgi:hypothetical protein